MKWAALGLLACAQAAWADDVGTAAPTSVIAAAADGSWAALCQARVDTDGDGAVAVRSFPGGTSGDRQAPYLVRGAGAGVPLDDVRAIDPSGRRLVVARRGRAILVQPGLGRDLDLTRLGATDGPIQFDAAGARLLFVTGRGRRLRLVVRDLAAGTQVALAPGRGALWQVELDGGGRWVHVWMNAPPPGQAPYTTDAGPGAPSVCWTGAASDSSSAWGTPPVERWIPVVPGGQAREVPGLIGVLDGGLLRRAADGALVLDPGTGAAPAELVPAACGGHVVNVDHARRQVVVTCDAQLDRSGRAPLVAYGGGAPRAVGATIAPRAHDWFSDDGRFLLESGADAGTELVDLATGAARTATEFQFILGHRGDRTVIQRGLHLVVLEPDGERTLGEIVRYPAVFAAGDQLYVEPLVVDLATGALVGAAPMVPVTRGGVTSPQRATVRAIARDGRLLVGAGGDRWSMTAGPLRWVPPEAP